MKNLLSSMVACLVFAGCIAFPLRPGVGKITASSPTVSGGAYVRQSQNPKQESSQKYERIVETVPTGTTNYVTRTEERGETHIGAAQKDTAREMAAKLGSLSGVVWVGVLVFLFGAASFVYPPLKALVGGSVTTSAVITGAGLGLIILPSLLVGHELLILAVAGGAAGIYWFAHRHGGLKGELSAIKAQFSPKAPTPITAQPEAK